MNDLLTYALWALVEGTTGYALGRLLKETIHHV